MKRILKWATGILFGVTVVAVGDEYWANHRGMRNFRKSLDTGDTDTVVWNYYD